MKKEIHPEYYPEAKVYVGGEVVATVGSTKPELHLEVWSGTHPFYTGEQRMIDTEGQVERFTKRIAAKSTDGQDKQAKQAKRRAKRQIAEIVDETTPAEPTDAEATEAAE